MGAWIKATLLAGLLAIPSVGWAQDDEDDLGIIEPEEEAAQQQAQPEQGEAATDEPATDDAEPEASTAATPSGGSFPIRRGFFVRGDFGTFFTIGGSDVDPVSQVTSDNSVGNLQPLVAITAGYDVFHDSKNNLSVGARFAGIFSASSAQVSDEILAVNPPDAVTVPADVQAIQFGASVDYTYLFLERFGLLVHADGGIALIDPDPDVPATEFLQGVVTTTDVFGNPGQTPGSQTIGGVFSGALGVEYYTRLDGFSIGFSTAFYGLITSQSFIPGIGLYIPLKYNF
jgi:hypothetical protein